MWACLFWGVGRGLGGLQSRGADRGLAEHTFEVAVAFAGLTGSGFGSRLDCLG